MVADKTEAETKKAKPAKAKAKPAKTNLTQKQAVVKAGSLLKGIGNSTDTINKHQKLIAESTDQLHVVLAGLSNMTSVVTANPEKKIAAGKVTAAKHEKATAKAAKVKAAKAVKPAKVKAAKEDQKPAVDNRPTIKDAIQELIASGGPDTKADLYRKVTDKYGYWSRQSFYNALKDKKLFKDVDGKIQVAGPTSVKTSDADAKKFVESVERDQTVATAL